MPACQTYTTIQSPTKGSFSCSVSCLICPLMERLYWSGSSPLTCHRHRARGWDKSRLFLQMRRQYDHDQPQNRLFLKGDQDQQQGQKPTSKS